MHREYYQTPGRQIAAAVPKDPDVSCAFMYFFACVSMEGECSPALVYMNKLQARVRYTHITCRYLRINHPEPLIAGDVLTAPNAGKPLGLLETRLWLILNPEMVFHKNFYEVNVSYRSWLLKVTCLTI